MADPDRRRFERHALDVPGELFLSQGRCIPVRIVNLGPMGALLAMADLEEAVMEGERVVLDHPLVRDDKPTDERVRTAGSVVRVELDFSDSGVQRHLAVYFDGGTPPDGCTA